MTQREFFNAVIAETQNTAIAEFATNALHKMDERNANRSAKPSKTQIENAPLIARIKEILTTEPMLASEIAEKVGISTAKASALVKKVDGVQITDVKVKGKGVRKAYSI